MASHAAQAPAAGEQVVALGEGVTRWKVGDEVVVHCNQASYEDVEVHGLDPMAAPSQRIWGYETTWGSFAQFTFTDGIADADIHRRLRLRTNR